MRGIKLISWVVGLSMVGGAVTTVPAVANDISGPITNNQTNILYGFEPLLFTPEVDNALQGIQGSITSLTSESGGQESINGALSRSALITLLTSESRGQGSINGVNGTLTQGGQNSSAEESDSSGGQAGADSAAIEGANLSTLSKNAEENAVSEFLSADTRSALLELSKRLEEIENGLWAYGDELDQSIRDSASGLSEDLAAAEASCKTNALDTENVLKCNKLTSLIQRVSTFVKEVENLRTNLNRGAQKARIY